MCTTFVCEFEYVDMFVLPSLLRPNVPSWIVKPEIIYTVWSSNGTHEETT